MLRLLFKDVLYYGAGDFLFKFIAFSIFPIYARIFTVNEFGVLALIVTLVTMMNIVMNVGQSSAVQRFYLEKNLNDDDKSSIVTTSLVFTAFYSIIVSALIIFVTSHSSSWLQDNFSISENLVLIAVLTGFPNQIIQIALDVLRAKFKIYNYLILSIIKHLLGVFIGLFLIVYFNYRVEGVFLGLLIAIWLAMPLAIWLIRDEISLKLDFHKGLELFKFGYPFVFMGVSYWLFESIDRWMLSDIADNNEVGLYSVAAKFAVIITMVTSAFGLAWAPRALKLFSEDPNFASQISRVFSIWFFLLSIIGGVIVLFSKELIQLLLPGSYWSSNTMMLLLILASVISGTTQITALGISFAKKTYYFALIGFCTALVNVFLNLYFIPILGGNGAALSSLISYFFLTLSYYFISQKYYPILISYKDLLVSVNVLIFLAFISYLTKDFDISMSFIGIKALIMFFFLYLGFRLSLMPLFKFNKNSGWSIYFR